MDPVNTNAENEKGSASIKEAASETMQLAVRQPEKIRSLLVVLADLEKISEIVSEDRSHDLGAGGSGTGTGDDGSSGQISARQKAIQSLPSIPAMRQKVTLHLQAEVKQLERKAKLLAHSTKKGSAYLLNELYARIRKIQTFIAELIDAAEELVKQLYIRLFIDHQKLV
jgi:hypothetical protein